MKKYTGSEKLGSNIGYDIQIQRFGTLKWKRVKVPIMTGRGPALHVEFPLKKRQFESHGNESLEFEKPVPDFSVMIDGIHHS